MDEFPTQPPPVPSVDPVVPISPPDVSPQNSMQTPKPFRKFPFLLAGLIILFGGVFGGFFLAKSSLIDQFLMKPKGVGCTMEAKNCPDGSAVGRTGPKCEFSPCPQITTTSPSVTPDPTAGWSTYFTLSFNLTFKYPKTWYVSVVGDGRNPSYRIQNYDPNTAPNRGYNQEKDIGKYLLTVSRWSGKQKVNTVSELETLLPKNDDDGFYIGDPAGKIIIKNRKLDTLNGFETLSRDVSYTQLPNIVEQSIFILDGKGTVLELHPSLDVTGGKIWIDQILSTFKFLDQDMGQECRVDSDCGVNICNCKAEPKQNLTPAMQACLRVCEGSVKCVNAVCVFSK